MGHKLGTGVNSKEGHKLKVTEAGRAASAQHNGDAGGATQDWHSQNAGVTTQSLPVGNVKQGRALAITCHSHNRQGDGGHTIVRAKPKDYGTSKNRPEV